MCVICVLVGKDMLKAREAGRAYKETRTEAEPHLDDLIEIMLEKGGLEYYNEFAEEVNNEPIILDT